MYLRTNAFGWKWRETSRCAPRHGKRGRSSIVTAGTSQATSSARTSPKIAGGSGGPPFSSVGLVIAINEASTRFQGANVGGPLRFARALLRKPTEERAEEAIRLARQLALATEEPEARGLLALMLLNHARLPARFDSEGRIVTLDRQDRGLWDAREIAEGVRVLQSALAMQTDERRPGPSPRHREIVGRPHRLDVLRRLLEAAHERLGLSARAHVRILRVARTIADLEGEARAGLSHLAEALQYRAAETGARPPADEVGAGSR